MTFFPFYAVISAYKELFLLPRLSSLWICDIQALCCSMLMKCDINEWDYWMRFPPHTYEKREWTNVQLTANGYKWKRIFISQNTQSELQFRGKIFMLQIYNNLPYSIRCLIYSRNETRFSFDERLGVWEKRLLVGIFEDIICNYRDMFRF